MSNTGRLYNKNFNVIETQNSFNDLYKIYGLNNNKDIVNELQGSILISLTPNANEILLCSDELYNLTPRFTDPIVSEINSSNIINVSLKYDKNYFNITNDGKLTLNSNIVNQLNQLNQLNGLTSEIKDLKQQIESLKNEIKELKEKDDESIDDDNLNTENTEE